MTNATLQADGPVSIVTLNRPERLNAIGGTLLADLHAALQQAQADPATRAIVLTGAGRAFCAGDDLKEFGEQSRSAAAIADTCERIQQITRDIMFGPKLVVGAVHGYAVGGGFEWVLNCDLVVAADDLVCFFPEMALGHFVTGGVTHLLPQSVGYQRAMELIVLGERHDANALQRLGIVNRVVPLAELMPRALSIANQVAARSALATSQLKRVINSQLNPQLAAALDLERQAAMACFASVDTAQRIEAFAAGRL
jgi:enoyl-CoA hydratase/carnithine racemase